MNVVELQNKSSETIIQKVWLPVGTLYYNQSDISEDIKKYFYGTWERVKGFFPVAVDEDDSDFVEGKTGGNKTHEHWQTIGANDGAIFAISSADVNQRRVISGKPLTICNKDSYSPNHSAIVQNTTYAESSLPPYKAFYAWIRVS